jgi:pimeloyl-ACP methyl ester carboxylesterase
VDAPALAAAGTGLAGLAQPALVVWGDRDPWLAPSFADAYAQRLPQADVQHVTEGGHWPWLDEPALAERVASFAMGEGMP